MIYDQIDQARLPQWLAQNRIVGLALDRLPNGRLIAAEVRKDEEGELHVPLLEMDTDSFYALASRLNLPVCESKIATRQEMDSYAQAMRNQSERQSIAMELRVERSSEGWRVAEGGAL